MKRFPYRGVGLKLQNKRIVEDAGRSAGVRYTAVSNSKVVIAADLRSQVLELAQSIAKSEFANLKLWMWANSTGFVLGFLLLFFSVSMVNLSLFFLWVVWSGAWIVSFNSWGERDKSRGELAAEIQVLFLGKALEEITRRQRVAEPKVTGGAVLLDGGVDAIMRRPPSKLSQVRGPKPNPQPMGVSHKGAEELAAQWMRFMGDSDARTTRFVADGGIDVESRRYVAQVKNWAGTVGVAAVRELAGVAASDGRKPIFFTSGTYSSGAVEFANRSRMALFVYSAESGTIEAANSYASIAVNGGL
jgi:hypothetical protein